MVAINIEKNKEETDFKLSDNTLNLFPPVIYFK
jgi:hypothetical protein